MTSLICLIAMHILAIKFPSQAILCALDELLGSGWTPNTTFYIAFGHDEEVAIMHAFVSQIWY